MLVDTFAQIATGFAAHFGAPFQDGVATWPGTPSYDTGGSIVAAGIAESFDCAVQFDAPTQAMRAGEGFLETDARLIVLAFARQLDTHAKVTVATGQNAGTWALITCTGDPAGIGYEARGRKL